MGEGLHPVDYALVALYLAATMGLGLWIGRRQRTSRDFFLAGRRLPWWAIGMSLVATDIGATDVIGVGGAAYRYGLAVANFEWIGCVPAMVVGALVFIPLFWRSGAYTVPEFIELRFNGATRSVLAACWFVFMACNVGILLLASARMLHGLFGGSVAVWIAATAVFAGAYTLAGGLAAVVYTDTIQCVVMIAGCLTVLVYGLVEVGGPEALWATLAATPDTRHHLQLILPADSPTPFPWPAIFFGLALVQSPAYWIGNQAIVQRSFGARSAREAQAAYLWGAVLKNVIPILVAVPGLIAVVRFPHLRDGDEAFPMLVGHLLPVGARGVFLAAFIAALMSSVDSYLNSACTIWTRDFYVRHLRPGADEHHLLMVGRVATALLVLWGVGFALAMQHIASGIYAIFQTLMAFFLGPAFAVLMAGMLSRRTTPWGAFAGLIAGIATAVGLFGLNHTAVAEQLGVRPLFQIADPFLYISFWAFAVTAVVIGLVSRWTPASTPEQLQYVVGWNSGRASEPTPAAEGARP